MDTATGQNYGNIKKKKKKNEHVNENISKFYKDHNMTYQHPNYFKKKIFLKPNHCNINN